MAKPHRSAAKAVLLLLALSSSALGAPKPKGAGYAVFSADSDGITIFPLRGKPIKIAAKLPTRYSNVTASPDGGTIYWVESVPRQHRWIESESSLVYDPPHQSRLVRLDLHSLASVDVPGVEGIDIARIDIRNSYILLWGEWVNQQGACGVWKLDIPAKPRKTVLEDECRRVGPMMNPFAYGKDALGTSQTRDWFDPDRLTVRKLPARFEVASLSPDGKLIAAFGRTDHERLFLLDAHDFSVRRELKWHLVDEPRWSPDSRYLLRGKVTLYCSLKDFSLDVDPPHTPVIVDVRTGKTKTLAQARCQYDELWGWVAGSGVTR